ncbi:hypothetical protein QFJ66_27760 [Raoultella terrigena]|uniref:hypothetical protein n=1 Tax=Raoultella terrigena TaxID=577 RepID=UPI002F94D35A
MSQMSALLIILFILYTGDVISTRTKAWVPSVFVCAVLFLGGYWTFFPADIISRAGITAPIAIMLMYLLITNMGTLLSLKELMRQWKTVIVVLAGIAGITVAVFAVSLLLFDRNTALITIPPLVGGIVSSLIMSQGASNAGLVDLSVLAILIYVMQGFAGYPLTAIMLQREGKALLTRYRSGEHHPDSAEDERTLLACGEEMMPRLFSRIPTSYNSTYFKFLRLAMVGCLAWFVSELAKPIVSISPFVLCLFFGVVFTSLGFLEKHTLQKANGFGFAVMALMLFIFDTLNKATPDMLLRLLYPMAVLIATAVIGMFIVSWAVGKALGVSGAMSFAISLTALYGFPADYIITNEAINSLTQDEKERQMLTQHMLGPMLVGGFISVTIVSVILAGILVGYLVPAVG